MGQVKLHNAHFLKVGQAKQLKTGPNILVFSPNPMPTACRARFFPGEDRSALFHPSEEAARLIKQL